MDAALFLFVFPITMFCMRESSLGETEEQEEGGGTKGERSSQRNE